MWSFVIFSSILQFWYVEVRISRSISESPLEFEITRVDCIYRENDIKIKQNHEGYETRADTFV